MYVIIDEEIDNNAIKYTLKLLLEKFLNLPIEFIKQSNFESSQKKGLTIYYGYKKNCRKNFNIQIYCSDFWSKENYLKKQSLPTLPLFKYSSENLIDIINAHELPILYLGLDSKSNIPYVVKTDGNNINTNIDLIASSFFMLTRYEEIVDPKKDPYDRFPAQESIAYKENFLTRPIVNEYVELFWYWLKSINPNLIRNKRKFELVITHDIDNIRRSNFFERIRSIFRQIFRRKSFKRFLKVLWLNFVWLFEKNKNTFNFILKKSKEFDIKPHFYFIINGTSFYDKRYDPNSPFVLKILNKIKNEGYEIGLHASYSSYLETEQLTKEKKILENILEKNVSSVRNHYLRIKIPETLTNFGNVNFHYDSSVGFSKCYGYRTGSCYPYNFYDVIADRELSLIEYPLMIMDSTLQEYYPMLNNPTKIIQIIKEQIDKITFFGGSAVLLFHNDSLDHIEFPWRKVYLEILKYCHKENQ